MAPSATKALEHLLAAAERAESTQLRVSHRGRMLASVDRGREPLNIMSVTKLVVGVAIGRAARLGMLALDDPIHRWFPEWSEGPRAEITLRHVMGHVSGLNADTWLELDSGPPRDLLAHVLEELELHSPPGTRWAYNNAAVMVLPTLLGRAAGMPFLDFVESELTDTLGVADWAWCCDVAGNPLGMAGATFTAADLAKIGELLAHDGLWSGGRLLDPGWVGACRRPPIEPIRGAGLLVFERGGGDRGGSPVAFGHDGSGGQGLWVFPRSGLVIARLYDNRLPGGGYGPVEPHQEFGNLIKVGAELDAALS